MKDPLAGHRAALNEGRSSVIFLKPLKDESCPVEVGEFFRLKKCGVEITRKERLRKDGEWVWRVDTMRIRKAAKARMLKRGGGYTTDPDLAMRSQDDAYAAATLDAVSPEGEEIAHKNAGPAPEPAAFADEDIASARSSLEAGQRYAHLQHQIRAEERLEPLPLRLARLRKEAREHHIDLSGEERVIERRLQAMESKINDRAA